MATKHYFPILALALVGLTGCGRDATQQAGGVPGAATEPAAAADGQLAGTTARPGTPFRIDYQIIGTAVVGSPVSIDLVIESSLGDESVEIGYQVPDPSALAMEAAQPRTLTRTPQAGERSIRERVAVIPQREGRLYINVRASRSHDAGSASTLISIPILVGNADSSPQQ